MTNKNHLYIIAVFSFLLSACGGGGGSSASVNSSIGGVAATGAPMAGAAMTLTCANGATKSTTADLAGQYSFTDLSGCTAPYVVSATGIVNGTTESLTSVFPTNVSGAQTLNVTPITNAIAATLSSNGDPKNLANNISSESQNISASAVAQRKTALSAALSGLLQSAGLSSSFDLLSGSFSANNQGYDKVLDNLIVDSKSSGVDITNSGGLVVDDLKHISGAAPTSNFSAGTITISKSTDFSGNIGALPSQILDPTFADVFQSQLNTCFATARNDRGNVANLGANCQAIKIASDYLNDGKSASYEFDGRLTNAIYDGAKFSKPAIVRYLSNDPADTRALVDFALERSDPVTEVITTVVEQSTATGGVLKLRGNRRPFFIDVAGVVQKRTQVKQRNDTTGRASTFYLTGIQFFLDYNVGGAGNSGANGVKYMHVTGPLLPTAGTQGIWLRKGPPGCDGYFTVWRDPSGNGAAPGDTTPANCAAIWQLSSRAATSNDYDNYQGLFGSDLTNNPHFADSKLNDADILQIKPGTAYKFEVFLNSNNTLTPDYVFYQRLRSRPYAMGSAASMNGEIDMVRWSEGLQASSIDAITPPDSMSGLASTVSSINVSYVRTPNAPPPFKVWVNVRQLVNSSLTTQVDSTFLPIDPNYVDGTVISKDLNNSGVAWNNPKKTSGTSTMNWIQLVSRNKMGTIILRDWKY